MVLVVVRLLIRRMMTSNVGVARGVTMCGFHRDVAIVCLTQDEWRRRPGSQDKLHRAEQRHGGSPQGASSRQRHVVWLQECRTRLNLSDGPEGPDAPVMDRVMGQDPQAMP